MFEGLGVECAVTPGFEESVVLGSRVLLVPRVFVSMLHGLCMPGFYYSGAQLCRGGWGYGRQDARGLGVNPLELGFCV